LIERDYYPLKQAAEILNCSEDGLIYSGVNDKLPIYVLNSGDLVGRHIAPTGRVMLEFYTRIRFAKLTKACLQELEAGNKQAPAIIEPEPVYEFDEFIGPQPIPMEQLIKLGLYDDMGRKRIGVHIYELRHKDATNHPTSMDPLDARIRYGLYDEMGRRKSGGSLYPPMNPTAPIERDEQYPPPMLIRDCVLVILHDDLKRLQESEPKAKEAGGINELGAVAVDGAIEQEIWESIYARKDFINQLSRREHYFERWLTQTGFNTNDKIDEAIFTPLKEFEKTLFESDKGLLSRLQGETGRTKILLWEKLNTFSGFWRKYKDKKAGTT
jgi:hypothetical protein